MMSLHHFNSFVKMENSNCEFVMSHKNNNLLFLDGFLYMINKMCDNVFYWNCVRKKSSSCGATVITRKNGDDHYVHKFYNIFHLHEPDSNTAEANTVRHSLKRKAADSFGQLIQKSIQDLPSTWSPFMPSKEVMRLIIHRERMRNEPKLPKTLNDIVIPTNIPNLKVNNC